MIKKHINKYGSLIPEKATKAYLAFGEAMMHCELLILYMFIADEIAQENKDTVNQRMLESYKGIVNSPELQRQLDTFFNQKINAITDILSYEQYFSQMAYARCVDNFLSYLKDLLAEVINKKPQIIKSDEKETIEFIMNFSSMEDLRAALAAKKIDNLTATKIDEFFEKRLGLKLLDKSDDMDDLTSTIKERNLIVHNRGRINNDCLKEYPELKDKVSIGEYIPYSYEEVSELNVDLNNYAVEIDEKVATKFGLELTINIEKPR